jgi:molecular chaperone DnaK (HSP70)
MAYVVGIDLGTTNTVVACAEVARPREVQIFAVEQRVGAGAIEARPLLPSFLYSKLEDEPGDEPWIVGEWARQRGAEVPARVIASSKSWLAHAAVDRYAGILPWGHDDEEGHGSAHDRPKLSPIDAAGRILAHVRHAWDRVHPEAPLVEQEVFLTVPASFDEVARTLTLEATHRAGFPEGRVRLLEEPQAAFLDWSRRVGDAGLLSLLRDRDAAEVLVCDVGGGTTDLSLMRVVRDERAPGGLSLTRVAVGDHLLLGGDNLDLALAHGLEARFAKGEERLSPARFAQLVLACRSAKEQLLASSAADRTEATVTLLGVGARLIGGSVRATLSRQELELAVSGFFPLVTKESLAEARARKPRGGLVAFGLPYASDPAITRHLAAFLERAGDSHDEVALLLNGGVFNAPPLVDRLCAAIESFTGRRPVVLPHADPDLAVARGAVAYGLSLRGIGRRIGGGSAHGYYVGTGQKKAVCVVPRGAEPGERHAAGRPLALTVGRAARFDLYCSDRIDPPGALVDLDGTTETMTALPPLVTAIAPSGAHGTGEVRVALEGTLTEVGTLELACVELDARPPRRFHLGFELRRHERKSVAPLSQKPSVRPDDRRVDEARAKIERVFGKASGDVDPREAKNLNRELERILGERSGWPLSLVRMLFDLLISGAQARRRSADHERAFWSLAGFLLRPGFGDPLDAERLKKLEPLYAQGLVFGKEMQNWRAWWVAWRRVAGGLPEETQIAIRDSVDPFLEPSDGRPRKKPKGIRPEPFEELLYLVSSLERVPVARRSALGAWILERTWTSHDPQLYAAIGRIGARVPAYASAHHVISPRLAESWLSHLLRADWKAIASVPFSAVQLSRLTGDRARDVSETSRKEVSKRLLQIGARPEWIRMVTEVVIVDEAQRRELFGEALPAGLRLVEESD